MGWCQEFGSSIVPDCDYTMAAEQDRCSCLQCQATCFGRFKGCPVVWQAGGATASFSLVRRRPERGGHAAKCEGSVPTTRDRRRLERVASPVAKQSSIISERNAQVSERSGQLARVPTGPNPVGGSGAESRLSNSPNAPPLPAMTYDLAIVGGTRYLVTGGAGFIGSHLVEALLAAGARVTVLDSLSTGRLENLESARAQDAFRFVNGSVLDELMVDEMVRDCEVVVHLAAAVGVRLIVEQPLRSFVTNIRGTENVIAAAHRYRRKVLLASTSEIYGKNGCTALREDSDRLLGPPTVTRWSYSTAKAVDEVLAHAYHKERGLPTIVARFFNTVGPRQSPAYGMVVPRLIQQALTGAPLTIYGTGRQTRCFCHVADVVSAVIGLLSSEGAVGEVFNVGSTEEISIRDLAERVIKKTGSRSPIVNIPYEQAYEVGFEDMDRRVPDTSKLQNLTGWVPTRTLNDILEDAMKDATSSLAGSKLTV